MAHELVTALATIGARQEEIAQFSAYYDGAHDLAFATKKFSDAFGALFQAFADNLCPTVVDAVSDKLHVTGFAVEETDQGPAKDAWQIWLDNHMAEVASEVHTEALIAGNSYVIVWDDDGPVPGQRKAILYPNSADTTMVHYDREKTRIVDWAAKIWALDDGNIRANMYYPDRIEKFITLQAAKNGLPDKEDAFKHFEEENIPWPVRNDYGMVPVFHFANNARLGKDGRSELTDVLPLQKALNKNVADMLVAAEFVAMPQRWAVGLEVDIDPATGHPFVDTSTGKPRVPFVYGVDRIWAVANEAVKFGEFAQANLAGFLSVQEKFRIEVARVSRTPLHYLIPEGGNPPSGEALKALMSPFLNKLGKRQVAFGNVWENVMEFALKIQGVTGELDLAAQWENAAPGDPKEHVLVTKELRGLGISRREALRREQYTNAAIDKMEKENETDVQSVAEGGGNPPLDSGLRATVKQHLADLRLAMGTTGAADTSSTATGTGAPPAKTGGMMGKGT